MDRHRIFARDEHRCVYCGTCFPVEELSVDHVEPRVRGGDHSDGNLVTCRGCNALKGHRRVAEFLRETPEARAHFFVHARHVWPRILRTLEQDLAREAATRPREP
jgi:5-methylcytosine-specific restriction endonuclease McrA